MWILYGSRWAIKGAGIHRVFNAYPAVGWHQSSHLLAWEPTLCSATFETFTCGALWAQRRSRVPSLRAETKHKSLSLEALSLMSWSLQMVVSQGVRVGRELQVKMCFWSASPPLQRLAHRPFWHSSGALCKHRGSLLLGVLCKTSKGQRYWPVFFLIPAPL